MTPERWAEVERLYHLAVERRGADRTSFLELACKGDPELRKEVESLLASDDGAGEYLEVPALEVAARQMVGQRVSHYRLVEPLGSGLGRTFKAEDLKLPRTVVVRFIAAEAVEGARAAAAFSHPHLCTVFDVDESEGSGYVVMELLEGQTLEQRLAERTPKLEEVMTWALDITDALEAAHARGIGHGDLRAANVFPTPRGPVKLAGLGLTGTGFDEAADIQSFGRVLVAMAAGLPELPGKLRDILSKATEPDRDVRYQHISDLRVDLKRLKREWEAARQTAPGRLVKLGRYQIRGEIASGGMGAVYEGIDPAIGRTVAVKTILPGVLGTPEEAPQLKERLLREARAAGGLAHPNIVTVFDVGEEGGTAYIVMELIQGVTLDKRMQEAGRLPVERALSVLTDAAKALDYAHGKGVVHRDVKPGNIMIRTDGVVKLADFGIAKVTSAGTLTAPGNLAGTPCFIAPEQLRGQEATARSDQFSLAVVAWTLLTGSRPFDAEHLAPLVSQILMRDPERSNLLSTAADGVLRRALSKDPGQRFGSCGEFVAELEKACRTEAADGGGARRTLWVGGAAVAGFAMVGALGFFASRPARETKSPVVPTVTATPTAVPVITPSVTPTVVPKSTPASTPKPPGKENRGPVAGSVKENPVDGLPYVWIPAGSFQMGCSEGDVECAPDEMPAHRVSIQKGFRMAQTETTVSAFQKYVKAIGRAMPPEPVFQGQQLNGGWADGRQPVIGVTYAEARNYCEWAGMRLPTEAEWEYAARAGDSRLRYGAPDEIAWYADNSGKQRLNSNQVWRKDQSHYDETLGQNENGPHAVGGKAANAFGLRDMLGNVWEWVEDWFDTDYYSRSPEVDPPGPPGGLLRVLRGGSWYKGTRFIRASVRHPARGPARNVIFGFRCAGTLPSDK